MKQIDRYVNSVYRDVEDNNEDVEILKEEMKNHLLEFVEELKSQGKSESESISIAIKRFGEEKEIQNELLGIFSFINNKAKKVLICMVSFFIMTVISYSIFTIGTQFFRWKYATFNDKIYNIMSLYNKDNIDDINKDIDKIINKSKGKITSVTMRGASDDKNREFKNLKKVEYMYPKDIKYKDKNGVHYCIGQIITEKGIKYDVYIRELPTSFCIPTYINRFKNISIGFLCCFIISIIVWILIKLNENIHRKYVRYCS
ncbi:hypothetical protein IRP63_05620 [Clostridium botulinum]|uniref:Uncharacterized protein n=1 Tax=Clostridium botulinum C/D str. DC5 TaxID=1443128 RepID=A0A0A0IK08_CLOBO|nr:permease prefix domain 1-containing protein [Clostridium botulinum]KGN01233.1 hypothetical protein Z955_01470 [Clostridium botulinum C/D str. DC5]KOC53976.1 hypothetical protein ADU89_08100 [Clostridium botulinum]KOC57853.1 hypothetical protein ADU90_03885 [Clostridium botulinum]MCD3232873.1 hypothetical protein [Clostridium botulinum D/C]MCD3238733.1 hypothetical protein [Clostridium botulinum D/C]